MSSSECRTFYRISDSWLIDNYFLLLREREKKYSFLLILILRCLFLSFRPSLYLSFHFPTLTFLHLLMSVPFFPFHISSYISSFHTFLPSFSPPSSLPCLSSYHSLSFFLFSASLSSLIFHPLLFLFPFPSFPFPHSPSFLPSVLPIATTWVNDW